MIYLTNRDNMRRKYIKISFLMLFVMACNVQQPEKKQVLVTVGNGELTVDTDMVFLAHFNNDSVYGESNTNVYDFSNAQNNGTITGASWNSSGKFSGAFDFEGGTDLLTLNSGISMTGDWTICMWTEFPLSASSDGS